MKGLLDNIYDNLDVESLNRGQVDGHLIYLTEIIPQVSSLDQKLKFLNSKMTLDKRIIALDRLEVKKSNNSILKYYREVSVKVYKYRK